MRWGLFQVTYTEPLAASSRCQRVIMFGFVLSSQPSWALSTPGWLARATASRLNSPEYILL